MKKNNKKALANKKSNNIPVKANTAPVVKKENNNPKEKVAKKSTVKAKANTAVEKRVEAHDKRIEKKVTKRLTVTGKEGDAKLIVANFKSRDEGLKVKITTKDKKGNSVEVEKLYHGVQAAKVVLDNLKIAPEIITSAYCAIKIGVDRAQEVIDALSPYARISIPLTYKQAGVDAKTKVKPKRKKKPTNNTVEVRIAAKKARKLNNLEKFVFRKKNEDKVSNNPVTWNGHKVKSMRHAKKAIKMLERSERIKADSEKRAKVNAQTKQVKINLAKSKKEQKLNFKEAA